MKLYNWICMIEHQKKQVKIVTAWGNKFLKKIILHGHISRLVENNQGIHNVVMIEINNIH